MRKHLFKDGGSSFNKANKMEKLAIDVGGVIIEKRDLSGRDTNFDISHVVWVPGALTSIEKLKKNYDLYILSFCGKKTEEITRLALRETVANIVPEEKWIFTRAREHKVREMKKHNISTLIDDTQCIISWVNEAGLKGMLFRGKMYPTWEKICETLMKKDLKKPIQFKKQPVPKLSDVNEFPPL